MLAGYPATMSYATIMVQVDADGEADGRIHVAAQLADRFQSRLIGISSWTPRPPLAVEAVVVDAETPEGVASRNAALKARGERFKRVAGLVDRRMEWRCDQEFPTPYVIREARAADLLVIGRERKNLDPYLFVDPASLLLGVGRPVLLVPPDVNSIDITKVVVAWKDTREAQRAVRDALPLLQQAEMIVLTGIYESPGGLADAEEGLEISIAAKNDFLYPNVVAFARAVHGFEFGESLAAPVLFTEEFGAANGPGHVRTYLQRYAGVTLPTPCDWPTYIVSNDWNDFDAVLVGPTIYVRYHWSTTA